MITPLLAANLITQWVIIVGLCLRPYWNRLEFKIDRAFGNWRPTLTLWNYPVGIYPNRGRALFHSFFKRLERKKRQ